MGSIVVGVDGSPCSAVAVRFALKEARLRGDSLVALHAWMLPLSEMPGPPFVELTPLAGPPLDDVIEALEERARGTLQAVLDGLGDDVRGVDVRPLVVEGNPAEMLLEASEVASLLVVGSRGHGKLHGLLLGSVSQRCAHHATCPVAIVPCP
jgi:nucleotide-binding universal stress UspA family protein